MTRLLLPLIALLAALALVRPIDHDESQYVAAALLAARGLLPYRDFAYLQMPLQPLVLGPVAWLAGLYAYPALRLANVLLGAAALGGTYAGARVIGAPRRAAAIAMLGLAATDIFLFSATVARNDALPAALFAWGMMLALGDLKAPRGERQLLTGLLLAGAAATKISYGLPALAYGGFLIVRRDPAAWRVGLGALPPAAVVAALAVHAPDAFRFEVLGFPAHAPAQYYLAQGRGWKLGAGMKLFDTLKFLALGPALLAALLVWRDRRQGAGADRLLLLTLIAAGLLAALLPSPVWRQYLLPAAIPLFVCAAPFVESAMRAGAMRVAMVIFTIAGLAPSVEALATGRGAVFTRPPVAAVDGPVATLAPELLPGGGMMPDPRFATGPFYFRGTGLLSPADEARFLLASKARLDTAFTIRPAAILTGGEGKWTSGDDALDAPLVAWAQAHGYRRVATGRLALYIAPR